MRLPSFAPRQICADTTADTPDFNADAANTDSVPNSLAAEVAACLSVFPILCAQLDETVQHVETSVVDVCASFQAMVSRARDMVERTSSVTADAGGDSDSTNMTMLIETARRTMEALLSRIEQSSELSIAAVSQMRIVQEGMQQIELKLKQVDELAKNARLVALNGRIEAARAGDRGAAFTIVANETSHLAKSAAETSDSIREIVNELSHATHAAAEGIKSRADGDRSGAEKSREEVDGVLQILESKHHEIEATIEHTSHASQQLATDISRAVMAMQFQDAMSQRIGHVVKTLEMIDQELSSKPEIAGRDLSTADNKWLEELSSRYVMAAQRETHGCSVQTADEAVDAGDDIELF